MKSAKEYVEEGMEMMKKPDFRAFLVFIVISTFIWALEKMRQDYTVTTDIEVLCTNVPDNYRVATGQPPVFKATISADGFSIVRAMGQNSVTVDVSRLKRVSNPNGTFAVFIPRRQHSTISEGLPDYITLRNVLTDTVYIPLLTLKSKRVPVVSAVNATMETQHYYSAPTKLEPDSVWISGTNNLVDTMTAIRTAKRGNITLHDTVSITLPLDIPAGIEASAEEVQLTYFVEPYTEKRLEVPVIAVNVPVGYDFKAFPHNIKVSFNVGLSNFEKVGPKDINIIADLADVKPGSSDSRVKVKLATHPTFIQNVTYSPLFVEYLLEKQTTRNEP